MLTLSTSKNYLRFKQHQRYQSIFETGITVQTKGVKGLFDLKRTKNNHISRYTLVITLARYANNEVYKEQFLHLDCNL